MKFRYTQNINAKGCVVRIKIRALEQSLILKCVNVYMARM